MSTMQKRLPSVSANTTKSGLMGESQLTRVAPSSEAEIQRLVIARAISGVRIASGVPDETLDLGRGPTAALQLLVHTSAREHPRCGAAMASGNQVEGVASVPNIERVWHARG